MINQAANPRYGRSPRYLVAALLGAVLIVMLFVSSLITGLTLGSGIGRLAIFGLPAILLVGMATFWAVRAVDRDPDRRRVHLTRAALALGLALLLWLLVIDLYLFSAAGPVVTLVSALACIPTTAFALWVVRRLDRNEKEPWRLVMVAVAWGGVVATALVIWANTLVDQVATSHLVPGPGLNAVTAYGAGFFEEIAKGLAVLLLFLVMRDEFDDVVDGIVYGAAVGLGFNFMESILYMGHMYALFAPEGFGAQAAGFQWYARQVLGLFFGHATYTALVGAGIGVARQLPRRHQQVLAIAGGWLIAIAAHFAWDAWTQFFPLGQGAAVLLTVHLRTLLMDGPFTAVVLVLLAMGGEVEGKALRRQLEAEAARGTGTVAPAEVEILSSPMRRFRTRLAVFARYGFSAYRRLLALQQAQLNLAMELWHRERREIDAPPEIDDALRQRILALRS